MCRTITGMTGPREDAMPVPFDAQNSAMVLIDPRSEQCS